MFRSMPLTSLLLETDSPALGPCLNERNVPALISAKWLAEVRNIGIDEVINITTENALKLYPRLLLAD